MSLEKTLQPSFIYGYTTGFCDGLTGKENALEMPQAEWDSDEKLDIEKKRSNTTFQSDVDQYAKEYQHQYKKIGYNWGHKNGLEQRAVLKQATPGAVFENRMELLAATMKIEFLEVNRKGHVCRRRALDPRAENRVHVIFTERFVLDQGMEKCEQIKKLLEQQKIQQAIENTIAFFDRLKDLENYHYALLLELRLQDLRDLQKGDKISKDDYRKAFEGLGSALGDLLDEHINEVI